MLGPRKYRHEILHHIAVAVTGRSQLRRRLLLADDVLKFRNGIDDHLTVRPQRLQQFLAPDRDAHLTLGQDLADQFAQCMIDRRIRHIAFELIELAGDEVPALRHNRLMKFIYQR